MMLLYVVFGKLSKHVDITVDDQLVESMLTTKSFQDFTIAVIPCMENMGKTSSVKTSYQFLAHQIN